MSDLRLANGTVIRARFGRCITRLPNGRFVRARANGDSAASAAMLGYGEAVGAMTEQHDALHARLTDMLGVPSHSLLMAAGCPHDARLAALEESAVLATQIFARAAGAL